MMEEGYDMTSDPNSNEIRIEIEDVNDDAHLQPQSSSSASSSLQTHTIRLQSPGGSAHYVEGVVVTTGQGTEPTMTLAHGNTILLSENGEEVVYTPGSGQQILQMVSLGGEWTDNGEDTILLVPKTDPDGDGDEDEGHHDLMDIVTEEVIVPADDEVGEDDDDDDEDDVPEIKNTPPPNHTLFLVNSSNNETDSSVALTNVRPKRKAALKAAEFRINNLKKGKRSPRKEKTNSKVDPLTPDLLAPDPLISDKEGEESDSDVDIEMEIDDDFEPNKSEERNGLDLNGKNSLSFLKGAKGILGGGDQDFESSSDDEDIPSRRCVVCLRRRRFTEDIFDSSKQLYFHIDMLIAHLNIQVKGTSGNTGICPDCMNHLQRWHVFNCAIAKRHETAKSNGDKVVEEILDLQPFEIKVYKNYKKMARVKEVYRASSHTHYIRRTMTEKDWDFFCDHLFHSNSVKSEKSRTLERFLTSREKLTKMFCIPCQKLIPNGKRGYASHMETEHQQCPVLFPCEICGNTFPEKDMTASTEDYYPHWISHFYFSKCDDCGKRFPTKRALGQHRHAVHKNRQVKCDKCGKVLANKMSLDLHLLRHLPDNEKKKYMIKCKVCKKKIAQWNMKSHLATHNEERPWKCDHCDATFKMKGALVSHRDVVHFNLKNHVCSICGDAFKSASSLRGHVRRHEGRKDYKCEVCLKEYYTYSALKGHKVVHQTARNFICATCGKAFKKKKALDEHVTLHTGVKQHRCPICGREVRVKSNLYKHMKVHKKAAAAAEAAGVSNPINASDLLRGSGPVLASITNPNPPNQTPRSRKPATPRRQPQPINVPSIVNHNNHSTSQQQQQQDYQSWPQNGTMMVTLDNGTVVSDVTPLVVSFVTDGLHPNTSVVELNSEQHAQLINAVAVQQQQQELDSERHHFPGANSSSSSNNEQVIQCTEEEFNNYQQQLNGK